MASGIRFWKTLWALSVPLIETKAAIIILKNAKTWVMSHRKEPYEGRGTVVMRTIIVVEEHKKFIPKDFE